MASPDEAMTAASPVASETARLAAYVPRMLLERGDIGAGHWRTEGTLMFADVSGFTRLTEKLSRHAKAGAEEIVRTISDVFTALLTASSDGGDVLKFSGDALVIFFAGDDHARRACHSASTMQRTLRDVGGIDSSRGRVRLRMSIGIHSDVFDFFCCGSEHLELFVLGEAASRTAALESAAAAGQILLSHSTAARIGDIHLDGDRPEGRLLRGVPAVSATATETARPVCRGIRRYIAPPLRDRLAAESLEYEHRRAAVAFVDVGGTDAVLSRDGPAEVFRRFQAVTDAVMDAAGEYGVLLTATDLGSDGGRFMLTAGAPDTTGDHGARLLRAGLRITSTDCGLPVRIGVNAGNVFVGAVGAPFRRTYSTMGDATNLAARLAARAPWGGIMAGQEVVDEVVVRFVVEPIPPMTVKGKRRPVEAAVVRGPVSAPEPVLEATTPLVGREQELAVLVDALPAGTGADGRIVEIVGEIGSGKSRLVAELRKRAAATRWLEVVCEPYEQASAYHTAMVLLRAALAIAPEASSEQAGEQLIERVGTQAPTLVPWLPLIAVPVGARVPMTDEAAEVARRYRRVRTQEVVADLLAQVVADPTVFVLEDAGSMDDASAELFAGLLTRSLPTRPWLAVITRLPHSDGLHSGRGYAAETLVLDPLDGEAATTMAAHLAERNPVPTHVLPELVEHAGGNPLFLTELVTAQADDHDELPQSIEAIVAARIDGLAPDDRRALRYLSVLGDRFGAGLLDDSLASLGVDSTRDARWARLDRFVSRNGDLFAFRNGLVRQVAYEGLSYRRRRELHARVADALAGADEPRASQLPLHLARAERWSEAWGVARAAAERARAEGANAVAGHLYDLALAAAGHLDVPDRDVCSTAEHAGDVWERAGLYERALRAYGIAVGAADDEVHRILLQLRRAGVHESAGYFTQALRYCGRARTAAAGLPSQQRQRCLARIELGYASARLGQGRVGACVEHATAALEPAALTGDREALAQAYHLLDRASALVGDHEAAVRYRDRALPIFAELGDLPAQGTVVYDLGADAQREGRLEEALWLYERSFEVRTRAGDVVRAASSSNAIGEVLLALHRYDDASTQFSAALRMWRGARVLGGVAAATRNLGVAALRAGRPAEAREKLVEAASLARDIGSEALLSEVSVPLGEALSELGRYVEAWEVATRGLDHLDPVNQHALVRTARRVRADALLRTGSTERARQEMMAAE